MNNQIINSALILMSGGVLAFLLKDLPKRLLEWAQRKMLYQVSIYQNDELFDVIEQYMFNHYKTKYKDVEACLVTVESEDSISKTLKYKQEENFFVLVWKGKRIMVFKSKEKMDKAQSLKDIYFRKYVIKGFRAKNEINEFLSHVVDEFLESRRKQTISVYCNNSWGEWYRLHDVSVKPFPMVIIDENKKKDLIKDLEQFVKSRQWYIDRGIRHKRCYLLHGDPGNGKTTIGLAIAEYFQRDAYMLNLNAIDNDAHLIRAFSSLPRNIILKMEDIDRCFAKRENVDSKISFSTLLNCLDGALCRDGMIVIVTTNHIEMLDEALLREGRMDKKICIDNPTDLEIKEYLELFYDIKVSSPLKSGQYSMAYVQEYCISHKDDPTKAIAHFQDEIKIAV